MKKDKGILSLFLPFALLICNKFAFSVANTLRLWYNNFNTQRVKFALMLTFFMFTTQGESPNKSALIEECLIRLGSGDNGAIGQLYNFIKRMFSPTPCQKQAIKATQKTLCKKPL